MQSSAGSPLSVTSGAPRSRSATPEVTSSGLAFETTRCALDPYPPQCIECVRLPVQMWGQVHLAATTTERPCDLVLKGWSAQLLWVRCLIAAGVRQECTPLLWESQRQAFLAQTRLASAACMMC